MRRSNNYKENVLLQGLRHFRTEMSFYFVFYHRFDSPGLFPVPSFPLRCEVRAWLAFRFSIHSTNPGPVLIDRTSSFLVKEYTVPILGDYCDPVAFPDLFPLPLELVPVSVDELGMEADDPATFSASFPPASLSESWHGSTNSFTFSTTNV